MNQELTKTFLERPSRFLFFTGKGGVGKTALACATAIRLADAGKRILLVRTDPASNLGEIGACTDSARAKSALDQSGDRPVGDRGTGRSGTPARPGQWLRIIATRLALERTQYVHRAPGSAQDLRLLASISTIYTRHKVCSWPHMPLSFRRLASTSRLSPPLRCGPAAALLGALALGTGCVSSGKYDAALADAASARAQLLGGRLRGVRSDPTQRYPGASRSESPHRDHPAAEHR